MKAYVYEEVVRFWYKAIPTQSWYYYEHVASSLVESNYELKNRKNNTGLKSVAPM